MGQNVNMQELMRHPHFQENLVQITEELKIAFRENRETVEIKLTHLGIPSPHDVRVSETISYVFRGFNRETGKVTYEMCLFSDTQDKPRHIIAVKKTAPKPEPSGIKLVYDHGATVKDRKEQQKKAKERKKADKYGHK